MMDITFTGNYDRDAYYSWWCAPDLMSVEQIEVEAKEAYDMLYDARKYIEICGKSPKHRELEFKIERSAKYSYFYAKNIKNGIFEEGERAIFHCPEIAYRYIKFLVTTKKIIINNYYDLSIEEIDSIVGATARNKMLYTYDDLSIEEIDSIVGAMARKKMLYTKHACGDKVYKDVEGMVW